MSGLQIFTALIATVTLVGVALGRWPWLRMNRATIALVGATVLIASGVIPLEAAYRAIDWNTIMLLFAMMVLMALTTTMATTPVLQLLSEGHRAPEPKGEDYMLG